MSWSIREPFDRLPETALVVPDELFVDSNGNLGLGNSFKEQEHSFYFSRSRGRFHPQKHRKIGEGSSFKTNNREGTQLALLEAEEAGGGIVDLPSLALDFDGPIYIPSFVELVGQGPGKTLLRNPDYNAELTGSNYLTGQLIWTGNYAPTMLDEFAANGDAIETPVGSDFKVVTRLTTTVSISPGDVVMLHHGIGEVGYPDKFLRRVVRVEDDEVEFHKPINRFIGGVAGGYFISKGFGSSATFNPLSASSYNIPSHFVQRCGVRDLAVETASAWQSHSAALDSWFHNIHVIDSGATIYGNAFQNCVFEDIWGVNHSRPIEIAEGGADCIIHNFTSWYTPNTAGTFDNGDPLIKLGRGTVLDGFDITDYTPSSRTNGRLTISNPDQKIKNGNLSINPGTTYVFDVGESCSVDSITVHCQGQMSGDLIRVREVKGASVRNITLRGHSGYAADKYTIRVRADCLNNRIENIFDDYGSVYWQDGPADSSEVSFGYLSWSP